MEDSNTNTHSHTSRREHSDPDIVVYHISTLQKRAAHTGTSIDTDLSPPAAIVETSSLGVGELEITPVSAAIARYLGIDLTAEGKAARNRRGISIVVHGAPLSGKTATAVALAKKYDAALLTVDGVITEAVSSGSSSAGTNTAQIHVY